MCGLQPLLIARVSVSVGLCTLVGILSIYTCFSSNVILVHLSPLPGKDWQPVHSLLLIALFCLLFLSHCSIPCKNSFPGTHPFFSPFSSLGRDHKGLYSWLWVGKVV